LEDAQARSLPAHEWQALIDLGFLWQARDYARTGMYFERALVLARHMRDSLTLARSLNRLGNWNVNVEQPQRSLSLHQEALALYQELQDRQGIAETYDL